MPKQESAPLCNPDGTLTLATQIQLAYLKNEFRNPLRVEPAPDSPATANLAVAHCIRAYNTAIKTATSQGKDERDIRESAQNAYRDALPPLFGHDNIRNFIACIAQGMLIQVLGPEDGARLLYAAQVASSANRSRPHRASAQFPSNSPKGRQNPPPTEAE